MGDDAAPHAMPECTNTPAISSGFLTPNTVASAAAGRHPGDEHALAIDPVFAPHRAYLCEHDRRLAPPPHRRLVEPVPATPCVRARVLARQQHEAAHVVRQRGDPRCVGNVVGRLSAAMDEDEERHAAPVCVSLRNVDGVVARGPDPRRRRQPSAQRGPRIGFEAARFRGLAPDEAGEEFLGARPEFVEHALFDLSHRASRPDAPERARQISTMSYCSCV